MKIFHKPLVFLILVCLFLSACGGNTPAGTPESQAVESTAPSAPEELEVVDYAAALQLDMSSETAKVEATVKSYVDGDTVHFHVSTDVMADGVLKARFLAVNTPESTGKIEEYGKAASRYTREVLENAVSIIVESETAGWNPDSTGSRYLAWVWYKTEESGEYRNLNIEILQNGLALPSSSAQNRYGETCMQAIAQARAQKLNLYSGQRDPEFHYGEAVELTLKELRTNIESYNGMKVAFSGVITSNSGSQGVYIEEYDPETDLYYGIYIYYGHNLNGSGLDVLSVGNEARIVGTVSYYEAGGTWQVSGLNYRMMQPDDPGNIQKLSEGNAPAWQAIDPAAFAEGTVTLLVGDQEQTLPLAQLIQGTSLEMKGLTVVDAYTTDDAESSSYGALTLTCEANGVTVLVRTIPLVDENGQIITQDAYLGKTIDVKGIADAFGGVWQIKVFSAKNITIN